MVVKYGIYSINLLRIFVSHGAIEWGESRTYLVVQSL